MAVFLAVVKAVDASPNNLFLTVRSPGASAIWRFSVSTDPKLCECIFAGVSALLCFRANLLDLSLSTSSCHFLLHSAEGARVDDCGMVVLDIVFRALTIVDHDLILQAVFDVSLVEDSVAFVFLVGEDGFNRSSLPLTDAGRCRNPIGIEIVGYRGEAVTGEGSFVDPFDCNRLLGIDLGFSIRTSAIPKESLVLEYVSFFRALCFAPADVGADVFGFALGN